MQSLLWTTSEDFYAMDARRVPIPALSHVWNRTPIMLVFPPRIPCAHWVPVTVIQSFRRTLNRARNVAYALRRPTVKTLR